MKFALSDFWEQAFSKIKLVLAISVTAVAQKCRIFQLILWANGLVICQVA